MNISSPTLVSVFIATAVFLSVIAVAVAIGKSKRSHTRARLLRAIDSDRFDLKNSYDKGGFNLSAEPDSVIYVRKPFNYLSQDILRSYAAKLARSGRYEVDQLNQLLTIKFVFLGVGLTSVLIAAATGNLRNSALSFALTVLLFFVPDLWIYDRGVNRSEAIERELPEAIDLMYLCVSAGLGINASLEMVAMNQSGAAAEELTRVLNEILLGGNRQDAFRAMNARTNNENLREFSDMMIKVDQLGIPLKSIFEELAKLMREKRLARVRTRAQQVQVKILAPLILCFLPSIFIVVLGPAITSIFGIFGNT